MLLSKRLFGLKGIDSLIEASNDVSVIAISGESDTGKTSLCLSAAKTMTTENSKSVLYVDTENAVNTQMLNWANIDLDRLHIAKQNGTQSGIEIAIEYLQDPKNLSCIGLVIIDCMTALVKDEMELHKLVRSQFPDLARLSKAKKIPLIVTLQDRYINWIKTLAGGGSVFSAYTDVLIILERNGYKSYGGKKIGLHINYYAQATTLTGVNQYSGSFTCDFNTGLHEMRKVELFNEANGASIIMYTDK